MPDPTRLPEAIVQYQRATDTTLSGIMELSGLHRCPNSDVPTYCGCAPGKCATGREGQR